MIFFFIFVVILAPMLVVSQTYIQQGNKLVGNDVAGISRIGVSCVSGDGNIVIGGGSDDNNGLGAVWVFSRSNGVFTQIGNKLVGTGYGVSGSVYQGYSVTTSFDASIISFSGWADNSAKGAVWVFTRNGNSYLQQGVKLVASDAIGAAQQGASVSISSDGSILAVGGNNDNSNIGAVWLWTLNTGIWVQTNQKLVGNGFTGANVHQGSSVVISYDKKTIVSGAWGDNSNTGAIWVFTKNSSNLWTQQGGKLVGSNSLSSSQGSPDVVLSISADAMTIAVGGHTDNGDVGASWIFTLLSGLWSQQGMKLVGANYISPSYQGHLCLSPMGNMMFSGGPMDNGNVGAVWQFSRTLGVWSQIGSKFIGLGAVGAAQQGWSVRLSNDESTLVIGGRNDNNNSGALWIFTQSSISTSCWRPQDTTSTFFSIACPSPILNNVSCTAFCNQNYTKSGNNVMITCINGTLNFIPPLYCTGNPCSIPSDTDVTRYSGNCANMTKSGDTCTPGCLTFPISNVSMLCTAGIWSKPLGGCAPMAFVSTLASTNLPLIVSEGTELFINLTDGDASQYYVSMIDNVTLVKNQMPYFDPTDYGNLLNLTIFVTTPGYYNSPTVLLPPISILYFPKPFIQSICPTSIPAKVNSTIIVQGNFFFDSPNIRCIVNDTLYFKPILIQLKSITCIVYWPYNSTGTSIQLPFSVSNDGVTKSSNLALAIEGTCETKMPGSVSGPAGCICPLGSYDIGTNCLPCKNGEYQDEEGQTTCKRCGNNQDTNSKIGSTSSSSCVCSPAYYLNSKTMICEFCHSGMHCPGNNLIYILPGYWRASNTTSEVLACPGSHISCRGTSNTSTSLCAVGYSGPKCLVCEKRYANSGYMCINCINARFNRMILGTLIVFAILFSWALIRSASKIDISKDEERSTNKEDSLLQVLVKVTMNYLQVLYYIGRLSSNWSDLSRQFFEGIGIVGALSPQTYTIQCAANWRFYDRLILIYISPAIIIVILSVIYLLIYLIKRQDMTAQLQLAVMLLLYEIHPTIFLNVISSLPCEFVPGTGTSYLKADYSVDCKSAEYRSYAAISIIYLFFYILGMVGATVFMLHRNYSINKLHSPKHTAYYKYHFFFMGYKKNSYYWEIVIMMRKMGIVGFSVLASPMLQLVFGNLILVLALVLNNSFIPFESFFVNRLESWSLAILLATVTLGFLFLNADANGSDTLWISVLLILINSIMTAVLVSYSFQYLRQHVHKLENLLLKHWRSSKNGNQIFKIDDKNSSRNTKNMELNEI